MKLSKFAGLIIITFISLGNTWANPNKDYGDSLDVFKDVPAYSSGIYTGMSDLKLNEYQCVNYIVRFYNDLFQLDISGFGYAKNYYYNNDKLISLGLKRYINDGSIPPKPGDILVFNGPFDDDPNTELTGHVAIITKIENGKVHFIEQNWERNDCFRYLDLVKNNDNTFTVRWSGLSRQ